MVFTYFLFISRHSFIYLLANMAAVILLLLPFIFIYLLSLFIMKINGNVCILEIDYLSYLNRFPILFIII